MSHRNEAFCIYLHNFTNNLFENTMQYNIGRKNTNISDKVHKRKIIKDARFRNIYKICSF